MPLICNGCYKSIWEVNHKLKHNDELRDSVNEVLKEVDMEFKGTSNVYHLIELYYNDEVCGVDRLKDSVTTTAQRCKSRLSLRLSPFKTPERPGILWRCYR